MMLKEVQATDEWIQTFESDSLIREWELHKNLGSSVNT